MVSSKNLLSYPNWTTTFTVHTDDSDKQLGDVISQNNKPIALLSRILTRPQRNYIMTEKEILAILECLGQLHRILFSHKINVFSYHTNFVYAANLSESQRVMRW